MRKKKRNVNKKNVNRPNTYADYAEQPTLLIVCKEDSDKELQQRELVINRVLKLMPFYNRETLYNSLAEFNHYYVYVMRKFVNWKVLLSADDEYFCSLISRLYNPNAHGVFMYNGC